MSDDTKSDIVDITDNTDSYISDDDDVSDDDSKESKTKKKIKKTQKMPLNEAVKTVEERSLYTKLDRFFKSECSEEQIRKMIKIINNEDAISLRLLNWFAMKHSVSMEPLEVKNEEGNLTELFDIKISYRARLSTHSKKYFDPFRRGKHFDYNYDSKDKTKIVETTLCQLNFFRWLFLHNLLGYVEEHFEHLKTKMASFNNDEKKKKEKKKEKIKKNENKIKKEDIKIKVKRFTDEDSNKLVIIM